MGEPVLLEITLQYQMRFFFRNQASINRLTIGCASSARTRFSHNYRKAFQAPESKCGSPLRSRSGELHLRKALHQIQERDLSF